MILLTSVQVFRDLIFDFRLVLDTFVGLSSYFPDGEILCRIFQLL